MSCEVSWEHNPPWLEAAADQIVRVKIKRPVGNNAMSSRWFLLHPTGSQSLPLLSKNSPDSSRPELSRSPFPHSLGSQSQLTPLRSRAPVSDMVNQSNPQAVSSNAAVAVTAVAVPTVPILPAAMSSSGYDTIASLGAQQAVSQLSRSPAPSFTRESAVASTSHATLPPPNPPSGSLWQLVADNARARATTATHPSTVPQKRGAGQIETDESLSTTGLKASTSRPKVTSSRYNPIPPDERQNNVALDAPRIISSLAPLMDIDSPATSDDDDYTSDEDSSSDEDYSSDEQIFSDEDNALEYSNDEICSDVASDDSDYWSQDGSNDGSQRDPESDLEELGESDLEESEKRELEELAEEPGTPLTTDDIVAFKAIAALKVKIANWGGLNLEILPLPKKCPGRGTTLKSTGEYIRIECGRALEVKKGDGVRVSYVARNEEVLLSVAFAGCCQSCESWARRLVSLPFIDQGALADSRR